MPNSTLAQTKALLMDNTSWAREGQTRYYSSYVMNDPVRCVIRFDEDDYKSFQFATEQKDLIITLLQRLGAKDMYEDAAEGKQTSCYTHALGQNEELRKTHYTITMDGETYKRLRALGEMAIETLEKVAKGEVMPGGLGHDSVISQPAISPNSAQQRNLGDCRVGF